MNVPAQNTVLFSAKDNVRLYVYASINSTKSDEVFQAGQEIGIATGNHINNSAGTWVEVNVIVGKKRNPWQLLIPVVGAVLYATQRNGNEITSNFWLRAEDGDYQQVDTAETDAIQAAADKAAADAKRKQALIDAVGNGNNPSLTASNGGTTNSNSYIWWIVGVVLFLIAALVVWRLAKRTAKTPQQISAPQAANLSGIERPKRLK